MWFVLKGFLWEATSPVPASRSIRRPQRRRDEPAETYTSVGAATISLGHYDRGVSGPDTVQAHLSPALQGVVDAELQRGREAGVEERVRGGDATLWGEADTPEIANRLGWLTIAQRMEAQMGEIEAFARERRDAGVSDVVLLGMGGSSLAPEVLGQSFGAQRDWPKLHVLDSTDAGAVSAVDHAIDPRSTLFVVSSKSGGTIEPLSMFAHFWSLQGEGSSFVAITDPGSGLADLAAEHSFERVFLGDPNIGGRYSALSPFGMVPAALMGIDAGALLRGAAGAWEQSWCSLGLTLSALAKAGHDKLTFLISGSGSSAGGSLASLGLWLEQLVAESTGKQGRGILPVAEEPLGDPASYGEDRVFVHLPDVGAPDGALEGGVSALIDSGHPVITIPTEGPPDLGRLFVLAELAVAVAGWGLEINPFDQPNVQEAKDATNRVLAGGSATPADAGAPANAGTPADASESELAKLLGEASVPDYVAIMGYVQPTRDFGEAIARLRSTIRDARKVTTTFGYGPRFLHSTGQFHKGGPPTGRFLQLIADSQPDVEVPGKPFTFTRLKHAQADGDLQTLRKHGLPAERVTLSGEDPAAALEELTKRIEEML